MAKKFRFRPDLLVRERPGQKGNWKLPVREWVREPYQECFGYVPGAEPLPAPVPVEAELDEEAVHRFEEQLYLEDYWARNEEDSGSGGRMRTGL